MSAPLSDVEPETTATALRTKSFSHRQSIALSQKAKRSYKTVDSVKRNELISMVNLEQKTIKEAASRLKINYSTAKHIIKSQKTQSSQIDRIKSGQYDDQSPSQAEIVYKQCCQEHSCQGKTETN